MLTTLWKEKKISGIESESKVPLDTCLESLKVVCGWKVGDSKRVSVAKSHRVIQVGEWVYSISIPFERVENVWKHHSSYQ